VLTGNHLQSVLSLAQFSFVGALQLLVSSLSQTISELSLIPVLISLVAFAPHKNIFGNFLPSLGQITISSASVRTGFSAVSPNLTTVNCSKIDLQGAGASL